MTGQVQVDRVPDVVAYVLLAVDVKIVINLRFNHWDLLLQKDIAKDEKLATNCANHLLRAALCL